MPTERLELASSCGDCSGLCCVALQFQAGPAFAASKPTGLPCVNLDADDGCTIHDRLRETGWAGCTVFECYGAGQRVTQVAGSWRAAPVPGRLFAAFSALQALHEVLFLLATSPAVPSLASDRDELQRRASAIADEVLRTAHDDIPVPDRWAPIGPLRSEIAALLTQISNAVRQPGAPDRSYADLAGKDLRRSDLRDALLRGATLIAADLRGLDLGRCDLLGADLRDADLRGTDAGQALFLTQPQVNAALGDRATVIPNYLRTPAHWHEPDSASDAHRS